MHAHQMPLRHSRTHALLAAALVLFVTAGAPKVVEADEIYRWVDANGVVNYTQQKPKGVNASRIVTRGGIASEVDEPEEGAAAASAQATPGTEKLSEEQRAMLDELKAAETARQAEVAKIREANCAKARDVLERLSAKARIRIRGADGEERAMPEDERQRRISEAQQGVATNCAS